MDEARPYHICGLGELHAAPLTSARRIVSILDTGAPVPPELANARGDVLTLRFDDAIAPAPGVRLPERADIEKLLTFDREHRGGELLVVHCTAGISRSTAALAILLAQRGRMDEATIFAEVRATRAKAWPNSLMIALADDILGARGRLTAALREHYKIQLRRHPDVGRMMIGLGREREIPFDRLIPDRPRS
jgi:predicted protein tyrosine phosphatase